jgi:hypothetical protein
MHSSIACRDAAAMDAEQQMQNQVDSNKAKQKEWTDRSYTESLASATAAAVRRAGARQTYTRLTAADHLLSNASAAVQAFQSQWANERGRSQDAATLSIGINAARTDHANRASKQMGENKVGSHAADERNRLLGLGHDSRQTYAIHTQFATNGSNRAGSRIRTRFAALEHFSRSRAPESMQDAWLAEVRC